MNALLLKDLRLSLDALRPWILIVVGFSLGAILCSYLPRSLVPHVLQNLSLGDAIGLMGSLLSATSIGVSAWIATTIVQGDRGRGGHILALTVPVAGHRVALLKLLAILIASLVPLAITLGMQSAGTSFLGRTQAGQGSLVPPLVALSAFVGAAFSLVIAPVVRGTFAAVALALLFGIAAGVCGWIGEKLSFGIVAREFIDTAAAVHSEWEIATMRDRAALGAVAVGIVIAAIPCAIVGGIALARPRSRRITKLGAVIALGCAVVGGVVETAISVTNDPGIATWSAYWERRATQAPEADIVAATSRWIRGITSGENRYLEQALVLEGRRRLTRVPLDRRDATPLGESLQRMQDHTTPYRAVVSTLLIPLDDPRRLQSALDSVIQFATDGQCRDQLFIELFCQPIESSLFTPLPSYGAGQADPLELLQGRDDMLRQRLTGLVDKGHAERERMLKAIEALKSSRPELAMWRERERASTEHHP